MIPTRVVIPTTSGPVEVQRITPEDPQVRSVICLNGTSEALPVSPEYDAFIRKPTGVIQQCFGHPVFRMDLSGRIESGRSWQLGVFIAHGLHQASLLAGKESPPGRVVWATGEVDRELMVRPVEHLAAKLERSLSFFRQCREQGAEVVILLPEANRDEVGEEWLAEQGLDGLRLLPVDRADSALRELLPLPGPTRHVGVLARQGEREKEPAPMSISWRPRGWMWVLAGAVLLLAGAGVTAWRGGVADWLGMAREGRYEALRQAFAEVDGGGCLPCRWLRQGFAAYLGRQRPGFDGLTFLLREWRAPGGGSCPATWRGMERATPVERSGNPETPFPPSEGQGLCGVRYRVGHPGGSVHFQLLVLHEGRLLEPGPGAAVSAAPDSGVALEQDYMITGLAAQPGGGLEVALLVARHPLGDLADGLRDRIRSHALPWTVEQWEAFRLEAAPLGVDVMVTRHLILPAAQGQGGEKVVSPVSALVGPV